MCVNLKIKNESIYDILLKNYPEPKKPKILKIIKINKMLNDINFFTDDYETVINAFMYVDISNLFHKKASKMTKNGIILQ
jgi:hypothetical protein